LLMNSQLVPANERTTVDSSRSHYPPLQRSRIALLFLLLVAGLASLYTITYSGQIEIADQMQYFDATGSVAQFGDFRLDISMWENMPRSYPRREADPLRDTIAEPGFILAAAPLYWLAERLDGVGLVHATYFFNVWISALLCGMMFLYGVELGYRVSIALLGALCLGLLTIVWPYTQTFFREPLMMLLLMACALSIERFRRASGWRRGAWLALAAGLLVATFFSKDAALLALPGLVCLLLQEAFWRSRWTRAVMGIGIAFGFVISLLITSDVLAPLGSGASVIPLLGPFAIETGYTHTALHTYLFSLGGSIWGTSPIALLALPGAYWLWRENKLRHVCAVLLIIFGFAYGYALLRGSEWFGGTIWPQRFLLPVLPFVLLLIFPALERIFAPRVRRLWVPVFIALVLYSLWWQLSGLAFRWESYSRVTYEASEGGLVYWLPGFNDPRYLRPMALLPLWGVDPLNLAWVRTGIAWIPFVFGGLALLSLGLTVTLLRQNVIRKPVLRWSAILVPVYFVLVYALLRAIYIDPAYAGHRVDLHQMVDLIRAEVPPNEFVMLADREYNYGNYGPVGNYFFLNYGKIGQVRLLGFPFHPGDRASCDQPLRIEAENPMAQLDIYTVPTINHLADHHERLWVLASSGPTIPCVVRSMERFMGMYYYRVSGGPESANRQTSGDVRLLEYHTEDAPDPYAFRGAEQTVDLRYQTSEDTTLDLIGMTLPDGSVYTPGDWLPISLYWQTDSPNAQLYTVAWFLAKDGGVVVGGENTWPGATFFPTTLWEPGVPIWDNRALRLPPDLAPGEYQLWVKLYYRNPSTGEITDLTVEGENVIDGVIGVLPVTVRVEDS
jgi:hypothetical protein